MVLGAIKRLRKEMVEMEQSADADAVLVANPENLLAWRGWIRGPEGTSFEGGVFELSIDVSMQYPLVPPKIYFKTPVFHPNIHDRTGEVCVDILKDQWTPAWSLSSCAQAIRSVLAHPNPDSPLNCDAGNLLRAGDLDGFQTIAKQYVQRHANGIMPSRENATFDDTGRQKQTAALQQQDSNFSLWHLLIMAPIAFFFLTWLTSSS